ncbi:tRNA threonylcarbamoyladenosine dehydratase [Treponema putidum]|uniref:tRNA threonylcarbamoyladenosine dehydratase n=1 Tax=Treponema putidum TaxID=221027 RepID=A0ABY5HY50_9SPIR|nr:tRNA threonylcarbamoyladenosine dehydratase [Treponema putidum]UTY29085.1 tRNA threonylcarbamoyladenosine dehydratase [Treponema putidum]
MSFLSRFEPLLGSDNLKKIADARIAVFGLGGVGSYTAEALARSGVAQNGTVRNGTVQSRAARNGTSRNEAARRRAGRLILIDGDRIEESNINRQLYALYSTIGKFKTEVAKERIADISPECQIEAINSFVLPDSFYKILGEDFFKRIDFIIDAVDTIALKLFLAAEAEKNKVPLISAMGCGNRLDADFEFADIYKTSVCPLCKVMRAELKKRNVKHLKVLYSKTECTVKQNPPASAAWVPSIAGLLIAGEVIKHLSRPEDFS